MSRAHLLAGGTKGAEPDHVGPLLGWVEPEGRRTEKVTATDPELCALDDAEGVGRGEIHGEGLTCREGRNVRKPV